MTISYVSLGLADVDLGYAGRFGEQHPIHRVLDGLEHNQALQLVQTDKRLEIRDLATQQTIGAIARKCHLPDGLIVEVTLDTLVRRFKKQSATSYISSMKVEQWHVPLVTLIIQP